jgi:hypothetical protein
MKRKKAQLEKASPGTLLAARARAEGNQWTDAEREKLGEQFMKFTSHCPFGKNYGDLNNLHSSSTGIDRKSNGFPLRLRAKITSGQEA